MHIQELDVRSQILTATGLLILEWRDERLQWDPDTSSLGEVVIEAKKLWVPEFAVINGADEIYADYRKFRAILMSDGTIRWEPGGVFKTMCTIDITYFPFDDQKCAVVFGAWSYHTTKMNLTNSSAFVNMDSYEKNGEWEIVTTEVARGEFSYDCCPEQRFSNVAFQVHIRRRYTFYVMNVILPSMVTSVLLLSIFYCPPGQKVQIGVVVLLSFRIFLLNVTDSIPKTSDHIPLLGIYLTCTMAITTLSMVLTVLVLNLHCISERPVPKWIKVIMLNYLGRIFCCRPESSISDVTNNSSDRVRKRKVMQYGTPSTDRDFEEQVPIITLNGTIASQETSFCVLSSALDADARTRRSKHNNETTITTTKPDYSKDWQTLAEVVDRLFFWTFLMAILGVSLLLFHPLTQQEAIPPDNK